MLKNNDTIVPLFNQSSLLLEEKKKSSIVVIFKNACTNFHKLSIFSTIRILYKILYILCNKRFDLIFKKKKKMGRHLIKFQNLRGKRSSGGAVRNDPRRGCESTALDCLSLSLFPRKFNIPPFDISWSGRASRDSYRTCEMKFRIPSIS